MREDTNPPVASNVNEQQDLPAGDFSSWLRRVRRALLVEDGAEVDCGGCDACCSSSCFIHIRPEETLCLDRINRDLLAAAPGLPPGHVVLGYDKQGRCPMLVAGRCSIYEQRPLTCCNYDCRVFAAAGITAGDRSKARISQRVKRWRFTYPTRGDQDEHEAVRAAANFIREHAGSFPGGNIPTEPGQLAIVAIKAYEVFLPKYEDLQQSARVLSDAEVASAVVDACRAFDAMRPASDQ
jgi:Fe-S-cluster containining protein